MYCLRQGILTLFCSVSLIPNEASLFEVLCVCYFQIFTFDQNPQDASLKQVYMVFLHFSFKPCYIYVANQFKSILDKFHMYISFSKN